MSLQSKREYLNKIRGRYHRAGREHKSRILDEFCANCGYHRKHAVRILRCKPPGARGRPGPKPSYGSELLEPLKTIWLASDQMCSKRLKAAFADWVPYLRMPLRIEDRLLKLSPATIDRLLRPVRGQVGRNRRSGTKPGTLLKKHIPIRTSNADITQAGFFEADTVAHCGSSMSGEFIWSLTFTDVATGYTLCRAVWNKGHVAIHEHLRELEAELPFALLAFDCDNGSEFLNHALVAHFTQRRRPIAFTRCRPNHKNDQPHVEQKNWSVVRQLLGYERLDRLELLDLLNDLYRNEWALYVNFFCPTLKLQKKTKIGSRYLRTYHPAQTPYRRLLQSKVVPATAKEKLRALRLTLDPFKLRKRIDQKLKHLFALVHQKLPA